MKEIGIRDAYQMDEKFINLCENIRRQSTFTTEYALDDDDYLVARFIHFDDEYIVTILSIDESEYEVQCGRYWRRCNIDNLENDFYSVVGRYVAGE